MGRDNKTSGISDSGGALALGVTMTDPSASSPDPRGDAELHPGTVLGRYQITGKLGAGGMGVVYRANDPDLDRVVAIKVLSGGPDGSRPSDLLQQRLLREAKAMARLSHPNLVTVYDVGNINRHVFLAMELVEGKTLRAWMAEPHAWRERLKVLLSAGKGLAAAHAAGVIHRDFKPDNVLIGRHVQVVDFGLARNVADAEAMESPSAGGHTAPHLTQTGALIGTPAYMSPEQHRGESTDERSDQFSFAVTAFHVLYGHRPFAGETVGEISSAVLAGDVRPPAADSDVPAAVLDVLKRALSTAPEARYPSMLALLVALRRAASPPQPRRRAWLAAVAVGAVIAAVITAVVIDQTRPPPPPVGTAAARPTPPPRQLTFRGDVTRVELSPGGRHMAYVSNDRLIVRNLANGNETSVRSALWVRSLDWSSDGNALLYIAADEAHGSGTYIYNVTDKRDRRVAPASARVCFVSDDEIASTVLPRKRITLWHLRNHTRRVIPFPGDYVWLSAIDCEPQHKRLVVLTRTATHDQLWTIGYDGRGRTRLVDVPNIDDVSWSVSGDALYYVQSNDSGSELQRLNIAADGSARGPARLVVSDVEGAERFSIAADDTVAYVRGRRSTNLWRLHRNPDGSAGAATRLTQGTAPKLGVTLSPDGSQLAYATRTANGPCVVLRAATPGAKRRIVAPLDTLSHGIAWSKNGRRLVVVDTDRSGVPRLELIDVRTGVATRLKAPVPSASQHLAWSPAGDILYQLPGNQNYNLVAPDTGQVSPLLRKPVGWLFVPVFSPTGDTLAVFWNRAPRGVWLIDMKTRKAHVVAKGERHPAGWSADGRWLYLTQRNPHGERLIERLDVASGRIEPWLHLPRRFERLRGLVPNAAGDDFVLNVGEGSSDVWMVRR